MTNDPRRRSRRVGPGSLARSLLRSARSLRSGSLQSCEARRLTDTHTFTHTGQGNELPLAVLS